MVWAVFLHPDGGVIHSVSVCTIITTGADRPSFLGRLVITYEDGHKETIVTDDNTWQYFGEGPYRYAGFFNGETYDARLEENYFNFSKSDFKADGLKKPEVITPVVMEEQEGIFPGAACWPAMNEEGAGACR